MKSRDEFRETVDVSNKITFWNSAFLVVYLLAIYLVVFPFTDTFNLYVGVTLSFGTITLNVKIFPFVSFDNTSTLPSASTSIFCTFL